MAFKPFKILKGLLIKEENTNTPKQIEITPGGTANTKTTILASQTTDKTLTLPDATDTLVGKATTDVLTNKSIDATTNTLSNISNVSIATNAAIDASKIANGIVSNAEFQQIDGLTSPAVGTTQIQTLTNKTISGSSNTISNISYSSLSLSNSIVNADINTSAAIAYTKLATLTASKALQSDGSGFIQASAVQSTELGYLSGVTSAIQIQINAKANQTLNNLTTTAFNATINPDSHNVRSIGASTLKINTIWVGSAVKSNSYDIVDGTVNNATIKGAVTYASSGPDASAIDAVLQNGGPGTRVGVISLNDAVNGSGATGDVFIGSGNKTAGTGNSGDVTIRTGTSSGGTRGGINLVDSSLSGSAVGYVWTLQNTTTGKGAWQVTGAAVNFRAIATSGQSIVSGNNTINWPTVSYDTNSLFSAGTTITVATAGKYRIESVLHVVIGVAGNATNYYSIYKNGVAITTREYGQTYIIGVNYPFEVEDTLNLAVNDIITLVFFSGFGVTTSVSTSNLYNRFLFEKIG